MRLWVTRAGGRDTEVELVMEGQRLVAVIEGRRTEVDLHPLPDGQVWSLLLDGCSHEVQVASIGGALEVSVEGSALELEVRHPLERLLAQQQRASGATRGETVSAPMPGLVVALRVQPGDRVIPGQPIVVIEAMKMQNELLARSGGTVAEVLVGERQTVSAGQPLVRIRGEGA
jgi:biotin carboxyl carrier protein